MSNDLDAAEAAARHSIVNGRFRGHDTRDWQEWATFATSDVADVPLDAERAMLHRVKRSHRGTQALRHLIAGSADQAYLDEIRSRGRLRHFPTDRSSRARRLRLGLNRRARFPIVGMARCHLVGRRRIADAVRSA